MKSLITLIIAVSLALPGMALAAAYGSSPFSLYSASTSAVKTSAAINVRGFATKTFQVEGVTLSSNTGAITFQNMSGTAIVQCSQDNTVWETCIANDYGQTAVSRTTNGIFTWRDAVNYVRFKWTSSVTGHKLKAWLSWQEN